MRDLSQYDGLRPLIKTGDLIEFRSNSLLGAGIMGVTKNKVSHSSIVVKLPYDSPELRRYIIEAVRTGLEFHLLSDILQHYDGDVIWYGLKPEFDSKRDSIGDWLFFELSQGRKYNFGGVLGKLFGWNVIRDGRVYCSEVIDKAYCAKNILKPHSKGIRNPGDFTKENIFVSQAHLWSEQS